MAENKNNPIENAEIKVELDGFVYFYDYIESVGIGLFKARPDGSELSLIVDLRKNGWSNFRSLDSKDDWIYFEITKEYSEFNEDQYEYDRYRDEIEYKVDLNGENLTEICRSHASLGSSN